MIRVFQRTMHNREGPTVESRELLAAGPVGDRAARGRDRGARRVPELRDRAHRASDCRDASPRRARWRRRRPPRSGGRPRSGWRSDRREHAARRRRRPRRSTTSALSPLLAVVGRVVDRADGRPVPLPLCPPRARARPHRDLAAHGDRPDDLDLGAGRPDADHRGRACGGHAGARHLGALLHRRASWRSSCRCGRTPCARRARASTTRCCSARSPAWSCCGGAENLITLFVGIELLSIPLYVLCATELRREESLEAGLKYLVVGSVGSATLLYGLALDLRRHRRDGLRSDRGRAGRRRACRLTDPLLLTGIALTVTGLAFKASVAPFHQWTPGRLPGRAHPDHGLHGGGHQGGRVRRSSCGCSTRARPRAARVGPGARRARRHDDRGRQRRRDRAALAQADARLVERRPGGLPARGRGGGQRAAACGPPPSTWPPTC